MKCNGTTLTVCCLLCKLCLVLSHNTLYSPFERERALCDETKYWLEKRENPNPPTERKSKLFAYS